MIVRTAVLEGSVPEANQAAFDRQMQGTVLDAIAAYPGIRDVRLRRAAETEAGAPAVYMQFDLYFDSLEAMRAALASPVRLKVRETLGAVMKVFDGRVYHLIMEEDTPVRTNA